MTGSLPKIGHTLWYVVSWGGQWLALLSFSARGRIEQICRDRHGRGACTHRSSALHFPQEKWSGISYSYHVASSSGLRGLVPDSRHSPVRQTTDRGGQPHRHPLGPRRQSGRHLCALGV